MTAETLSRAKELEGKMNHINKSISQLNSLTPGHNVSMKDSYTSALLIPPASFVKVRALLIVEFNDTYRLLEKELDSL